MSKPTEPRAFVHAIVPVWGDLDPARIVYTGRYTDYAMRAIDAWFLERVGADFYTMNFDWGIGTPFVHIECDLKSSLTPRDVLLVAIRVKKIGSTSLTFDVEGTVEADGRPCFEGRFVCVCVEAAQQSQAPRAIALDKRIRVAAEADLAIHQTLEETTLSIATSTAA